jgi:lipoprotein NlpD
MARKRAWLAPLVVHAICAALLAACSTARAPVDQRGDGASAGAPAVQPPPPVPIADTVPVPANHRVARGDTLYSIAFRYGLDYRDIARWNGIRDPYVIFAGQSLKLQADARSGKRVSPAPARPPAPRPAPATQAPDRPNASATPVLTGALQWHWPTAGRIVHSNTPTSKKGVDIAGVQGQAVIAAAAGAVVYSGSGLLGYGRLIILKHSDTFLSAYAYNEQLLVAEGDQVSAGQQIATMGTDNDGRAVLHFEIRRDGKPVNPLDHLPREAQAGRT